VIGDEAVHAGVAGIINAGGRTRSQEERIGGGDGSEPGGAAPDHRSQCQQAGAVVLVVQVAPQWGEHRSHHQRTGVDGAPLGVGHVKRIHDRILQWSNEKLVGLMNEHEEEKDDGGGGARPGEALSIFHVEPVRCF
jgi:hypothetical protein